MQKVTGHQHPTIWRLIMGFGSIFNLHKLEVENLVAGGIAERTKKKNCCELWSISITATLLSIYEG